MPLGRLLVDKNLFWVLGMVGATVKIGDTNIKNSFGASLEESTDGNVTMFMSVGG